MLVLVIVLVVTNLATLGALAYLWARPADGPRPDQTVAAALDRSPRPPTAPGGTRRMISIEILNPIELAGTRGRLAGIAGSLLPGLTRRIVYDQTLTILKQQLVEQQVVADVRLHTLRPVEPAALAERVERSDRSDRDRTDRSGRGARDGAGRDPRRDRPADPRGARPSPAVAAEPELPPVDVSDPGAGAVVTAAPAPAPEVLVDVVVPAPGDANVAADDPPEPVDDATAVRDERRERSGSDRAGSRKARSRTPRSSSSPARDASAADRSRPADDTGDVTDGERHHRSRRRRRHHPRPAEGSGVEYIDEVRAVDLGAVDDGAPPAP